MYEDKAREVLTGLGMTYDEATNFIQGVKRGMKARREGKSIPWSQVKRDLGLDEEGEKAARKQWTMNCLLAGVELARLVRGNKLQEATDYLVNLTSELTTIDINYLMNRIIEMVAKWEESE